MRYCLAIDIGASSGRHIVGWQEDGELRTQEVYRFPNGAKESDGRLIWDMESMFESVAQGIAAAFRQARPNTTASSTSSMSASSFLSMKRSSAVGKSHRWTLSGAEASQEHTRFR